ncbi:MAG: ATP-dependent DNA helicase RecG [Chloroflexota bacterium]
MKKFFKLEAERGYDNRAVLGGLECMLDTWESEARIDNLPEEIIQAVISRVRDYQRLSPNSREVVLKGIWQRIRQTVPTEEEPMPPQDETTTPQQDVTPVPEKQEKRDQVRVVTPAQTRQPPQTRIPIPQVKDMTEGLDAPISVLSGIGPRSANKLAQLGLNTLGDMLYFFPRRYDDYSQLKTINRLGYGEKVTVIGEIKEIASRPTRNGRLTLTEAIITDGSGVLRATWFNQPWLPKQLKPGQHIVLSGQIDQYLGRLVLTNPEWEPLDRENLHTNRIVPVYPLTAQITQKWLRSKMYEVISYWAERVPDHLSEHLCRDAELVDLSTALLNIHFPNTLDEIKAAQHRLAFDEIFMLQIGVLRQKHEWMSRSARIFTAPEDWLQDQINRLPFQLTPAQQHALADISSDLTSGYPMNRLLQGDVGSGKTVIAALALAIITRVGAQGAFMAPTSILAEQHYASLLNLLAGSQGTLANEEIRLLLGATPEAEKSQIRTGLENGDIKVVVGTHALLQEPVAFTDLQLAIIDEQHRFGVEQRAALRAKGDNPHLMVMTATPIPRSLALTIYGDLDLTIIDELPPSRQEVATYLLLPRERERAYTLIRKQVAEGRQAFIIYPLIEESGKSEVKAATEEYNRLKREVFLQLRIGLLHGRLKPEEKEAVMNRFRSGELQILVSTSVVEVGVDIPNATVMLIEGANRFGLAQLHQFRGRVGRGAEKSYCLLIPETENDADENERLQAMVETNDGFVLAERDLQQRGPGEFLGTRQAGFTNLRMANLTNVHLIEKARHFAQRVFQQDPDLTQPEHHLLAHVLDRFWVESTGEIS